MNRSTVEQTKFKLKTLSNWSSRRRADHRGSESYGTAVGANLAIDREQTERVKEKSQFSHGIEVTLNVRSQLKFVITVDEFTIFFTCNIFNGT